MRSKKGVFGTDWIVNALTWAVVVLVVIMVIVAIRDNVGVA
jgi:hypothetical protein